MAENIKKLFTFKKFLWAVYIAILAVITPHTQWMFAQWEPTSREWVSWVAAVGFESAIFIVTHFLVERIEKRKSGTFNFEKERIRKLMIGSFPLGAFFAWWPVFRYRWLNIYTLLLFVSCGVSAGANITHAVEFARPLKVVSDWGVPESVLTVVFAGILPLVNLLFAAVIADTDDTEQQIDPALKAAKDETKEAKAALKQANAEIEKANTKADEANRRALEAEQQMRGVAKLMSYIFDKDMQLRDRIRGLATDQPNLSQNRIAALIGCSTSTVNEALKDYIVVADNSTVDAG